MKVPHVFVAIALVLCAVARAQTGPGTAPSSPPDVSGAAPISSLSDGEVRKIDKGHGKLTLRHGPIAKLDMPAMTMVFKVADPKMLDTLKEGDKVRFAADRVGGVITITSIEAARP